MAKVFTARCAAVWIALAVGTMVLAGAAWAQPATFFGLTFPGKIADALLGESTDYESKSPGLGYSVKYRAPGWVNDVYIYDLGRSAIPPDPTSEPVAGQLLQATGDVVHRPSATGIRVRLRYALLDDKARVRFLCTSFSYSDRDIPVDSYLCVTSWNNKFVKFRLTTPSHIGSEAEANEFVLAWVPVLWPT